MGSVTQFFSWLFNSRSGVICLVVGGMLLCLVISIFLEKKTKKMYFDHPEESDDDDLFTSIFGSDKDS